MMAERISEVVFAVRQTSYLHAYRRYERALRNFERIRGIHRGPEDLEAYRAAEARVIEAEDRLDAAVAALGI